MRVLDPEVPVLFTPELLVELAVLLYSFVDLLLTPDLPTLVLEPLVRPEELAMLDLPLVDPRYTPVLLPDLF